MLSRQKIALSLLAKAGKPLSPTVFVKLMFLLRQEPVLRLDQTFYDFVPYKYGPFSFVLYRELDALRKYGYVVHGDDRFELCRSTLRLTWEKVCELPKPVQCAVEEVLDQYGSMSQNDLLKNVYQNYPWYAVNSEIADHSKTDICKPAKAKAAVYTAGYESQSVDSFLNGLLESGIEVIVDVRANPISRKFGFSGLQLGEVARKLGIDYRHYPKLGIPSSRRTDLGSLASYEALFQWYEETHIPLVGTEIAELAQLMRERASVLVCMERDVRCCHRSRLAKAVSQVSGLEVHHL